jgi:NDP-sugar pyrophosphorylase family protein
MTYAIMLAAGRGSRLAPLTDTSPKPLIKVQGLTLLERNMKAISNIVDGYILVIGYLGEMIIEHIGETFEGKPVTYVRQDNPKGGTLDAFRTGTLALPSTEVNMLVMNSDDIHGGDIFENLSSHISEYPDTPALASYVYPIKERLSQFGIIQESKPGVFDQIIEKPQEYVSDLVNIGIYYYPAHARTLIPEKPEVYQGEEYITDFLNILNEKFSIKNLYSREFWMPISTPEDVKDAEKQNF